MSGILKRESKIFLHHRASDNLLCILDFGTVENSMSKRCHADDSLSRHRSRRQNGKELMMLLLSSSEVGTMCASMKPLKVQLIFRSRDELTLLYVIKFGFFRRRVL